MNDKLLNMLGLCRRAGKLICGFDPVVQSVRDKNAKIVIAASDLSPKTLKELEYILKATDVPLCFSELTLDEIQFAIGRRTGVISTEDKNFAATFKSLLQSV